MNKNSSPLRLNLFVICIAVLSFTLLSASVSLAGPKENTKEMPATLNTAGDWDLLFTACDGNWDQYEIGLNRLRGTLKRQIDAMPQDEFLNRFHGNDPMLRFVRIHWPILLSSKDPGWTLYRGCAERNLRARNVLAAAGTPAKEREAKITDLRECLLEMFGMKETLPEPFSRLLVCYQKRVK